MKIQNVKSKTINQMVNQTNIVSNRLTINGIIPVTSTTPLKPEAIQVFSALLGKPYNIHNPKHFVKLLEILEERNNTICLLR